MIWTCLFSAPLTLNSALLKSIRKDSRQIFFHIMKKKPQTQTGECSVGDLPKTLSVVSSSVFCSST